MTPNTKYLLAGVAGAAVTKFYFHRSWLMAGIVALSVVSTVAIISAQSKP